MSALSVDPQTERAARLFLARIANRFDMRRAILFGSRARHSHRSDSDADIAVVLKGPPRARTKAALEMAGVAFDVMLDTGILVQALPIWEDELDHPESFRNPGLIENIRREGIPL